MNVIDSSAWLSYFASDSNSGIFAAPIERISELLVPSITITEEVDRKPAFAGFSRFRGRRLIQALFLQRRISVTGPPFWFPFLYDFLGNPSIPSGFRLAF